MNYARLAQAMKEWAQHLPNEEDIRKLMELALNRTYETGQEHMVHPPLPGTSSPVMMTGTQMSVAPHELVQDPRVWMQAGAGNPALYNLHTHPEYAVAQMPSGGNAIVMPSAAQRDEFMMRGAQLYDLPMFSQGDLGMYRGLAFKHTPEEDMRFALGTPRGSFIGAQVRPSPTGPTDVLTPYEKTMSRLYDMQRYQHQIPEDKLSGLRSYVQQVYGFPEAMENVAATAPLFKTQGELVEPLNLSLDPQHLDVINEYIQRSGMRRGGHFEEQFA